MVANMQYVVKTASAGLGRTLTFAGQRKAISSELRTPTESSQVSFRQPCVNPSSLTCAAPADPSRASHRVLRENGASRSLLDVVSDHERPRPCDLAASAVPAQWCARFRARGTRRVAQRACGCVDVEHARGRRDGERRVGAKTLGATRVSDRSWIRTFTGAPAIDVLSVHSPSGRRPAQWQGKRRGVLRGLKDQADGLGSSTNTVSAPNVSKQRLTVRPIARVL